MNLKYHVKVSWLNDDFQHSLHVASTQIKQCEKCARWQQTKITIKIQKIENRLNELLIHEFIAVVYCCIYEFNVSFMNLKLYLWIYRVVYKFHDWTKYDSMFDMTFQCAVRHDHVINVYCVNTCKTIRLIRSITSNENYN